METWEDTSMRFKSLGHPGTTDFEWRRISYRTLELTGDEAYEDLLGYDGFLMAMGAYNEDKIPMLLPSDWRQGNNCSLFLFNNVRKTKTSMRSITGGGGGGGLN